MVCCLLHGAWQGCAAGYPGSKGEAGVVLPGASPLAAAGNADAAGGGWRLG